jgi:transposase
MLWNGCLLASHFPFKPQNLPQLAELLPWQARGLFVFYLPAYSPHLNIVETLWRKLKYEWLLPEHYATPQSLFYGVRQALAAVGTGLRVRFSAFKNTAT